MTATAENDTQAVGVKFLYGPAGFLWLMTGPWSNPGTAREPDIGAMHANLRATAVADLQALDLYPQAVTMQRNRAALTALRDREEAALEDLAARKRAAMAGGDVE